MTGLRGEKSRARRGPRRGASSAKRVIASSKSRRRAGGMPVEGSMASRRMTTATAHRDTMVRKRMQQGCLTHLGHATAHISRARVGLGGGSGFGGELRDDVGVASSACECEARCGRDVESSTSFPSRVHEAWRRSVFSETPKESRAFRRFEVSFNRRQKRANTSFFEKATTSRSRQFSWRATTPSARGGRPAPR